MECNSFFYSRLGFEKKVKMKKLFLRFQRHKGKCRGILSVQIELEGSVKGEDTQHSNRTNCFAMKRLDRRRATGIYWILEWARNTT